MTHSVNMCTGCKHLVNPVKTNCEKPAIHWHEKSSGLRLQSGAVDQIQKSRSLLVQKFNNSFFNHILIQKIVAVHCSFYQ